MNKNNKKIHKKGIPIAVIAVASTIVIVTVAFFIPKNNGSFNLRSMTAYFQVRTFLRNVISGEYEKAFEYVYYYDETPENGSEKTYDEAKKIWCDRLLSAKENCFSEFLAEYKNLDVFLRDGEIIATFDATVYVRGIDKQYNTQIKFYNDKIAGISCEQVLTDFENTISGNLGI